MSIKTKNMSGSSAPSNQRNLMILGVIVVVALVAAVAFILLSSNTNRSSGIDYSTIPQSRTADGGFVIGNPNAPVTIIEVADFLCPHCQTYKATTDRIMAELVVPGLAKFEYRMLNTQGDSAKLAANLAECSEEVQPGSFWKAHDTLFNMASSARFTAASGRTFAERMGINYGELLNCTGSARQLDVDSRVSTSWGVTGTPTILVRYGDGQPTKLGGGELSFDRIREVVLAANAPQ